MGLKKRRFIALALAGALSGGLVACDDDSSAEAPAAAEATSDDAVAEETVELNLEKLPFYATGPVAKVNGKEISADEFNQMVQMHVERLPGPLPPQMVAMFRGQTLERMVDKQLIETLLDEQNIEVSDEDVEKSFAEFRSQFPDDATFEGYLGQLGMTVEEIKESMVQDVKLERHLGTIYDLEVSEEAMREFYEMNKEHMGKPELIHARHILVQVDQNATEEQAADAQRRAQEIYALTQAPDADFETIAREKSEGPAASRGGDLGQMSRQQLVPEFADVAFAMEPGAISEPVRSRFGYHIIQLVEKQAAEDPNFDNVKDRIALQLRGQRLAEVFQTFLTELRENAEIETFEDNIKTNAEFAEQQAPQMPQQMPQMHPSQQQPQQQGQAAPQIRPAQQDGEQRAMPRERGAREGQKLQLQLDPSLQ